jgi:hypothetical protein
MTTQDIILNTTTQDLLIENGDFVVNNSEQQETNLIINLNLGNLFEYPLVGVGIMNYLASTISPMKLESIIQQQLESDGFIVDSINVKGSTIKDISIQVLASRK